MNCNKIVFQKCQHDKRFVNNVGDEKQWVDHLNMVWHWLRKKHDACLSKRHCHCRNMHKIVERLMDVSQLQDSSLSHKWVLRSREEQSFSVEMKLITPHRDATCWCFNVIVNTHCRCEQKNNKISRASAAENMNLMTQSRNRLQRQRSHSFNVQTNGTFDQLGKFISNTEDHFGTPLRKDSDDDTISASSQSPVTLLQNDTACSKTIAGEVHSCDDVGQQNLLTLSDVTGSKGSPVQNTMHTRKVGSIICSLCKKWGLQQPCCVNSSFHVKTQSDYIPRHLMFTTFDSFEEADTMRNTLTNMAHSQRSHLRRELKLKMKMKKLKTESKKLGTITCSTCEQSSLTKACCANSTFRVTTQSRYIPARFLTSSFQSFDRAEEMRERLFKLACMEKKHIKAIRKNQKRRDCIAEIIKYNSHLDDLVIKSQFTLDVVRKSQSIAQSPPHKKSRTHVQCSPVFCQPTPHHQSPPPLISLMSSSN